MLRGVEMDKVKQCKHCEFNFNGICVGHSDLYKYGETIKDDSLCCDLWKADVTCFCMITREAPRFLLEKLHDSKITRNEFIELFIDYVDNKNIPINTFDAIKETYGLSMVDIAVLLKIPFGAVYRAKSKGFTEKRLQEFSDKLYIKPTMLQKTTTGDLKELVKTSDMFWSQSDIESIVLKTPDWKLNLIETLTKNLRCTPDLSKIFSRIDKLYWNVEMPLKYYTDSEQKLIQHFIKKQDAVQIEYFLDHACRPHLRVRYRLNNNSK